MAGVGIGDGNIVAVGERVAIIVGVGVGAKVGAVVISGVITGEGIDVWVIAEGNPLGSKVGDGKGVVAGGIVAAETGVTVKFTAGVGTGGGAGGVASSSIFFVKHPGPRTAKPAAAPAIPRNFLLVSFI